MKKNAFWNDAAKCGAVLGAVLVVSFILESLLIRSGNLWLYTLEWILVVALHYYLLHRFTRRRSMLFDAEEGFSFGQGYGFLLTVSAFSGFLFGVVQYIYLRLIFGYANYTESVCNGIMEMFARNGGIPASTEQVLALSFDQLRNASEPSVLATVWSGIFTCVLFGAVFGLIVAGVVSRAPRPFDKDNAE